MEWMIGSGLIIVIVILIIGIGYIKHNNDQLIAQNRQLMERISQKVNDQFLAANQSRGKELDLIYKILSNADEKQQQLYLDLVKIAASLKTSETTMRSLSDSVGSLNRVLNDKKIRGIYGETILSNVYEQVFGSNHKYYDLQVQLSNHTIVDSVVYLPEPLKLVCVDSKFPLENYNRLMNCGSDQERNGYNRQFESDVLKHVQTIASKYIIPNETADFAVMFIPAQSVYDYIVDHYDRVIELANRYHVVLASPVNLLMLVETMAVLYGKISQFEQSNEIVDEIRKLNIEFDRFKQRWTDLRRDLNKVVTDAHAFQITVDKISDRTEQITRGDIEEN